MKKSLATLIEKKKAEKKSKNRDSAKAGKSIKKSKGVAEKKSTFSPGKGKTWADKLLRGKAEVKKTVKDFADIPAGSVMLIATPKIIDEYVRQIPKGVNVTLQTMRKDLASEYKADYTCPVTAGIFLRIAAEAAIEAIDKGTAMNKVMPFWRMVDEKSPMAKKLSCGVEFLISQRKKEGLKAEVPLRKK